MKIKLAACHNAGQLVFGYVAGNGGAIPLNPSQPGGWWLAPRIAAWPNQLNGQVVPAAAGAAGARMSLKGQIDTWKSTYRGLIDGIYVDEGPVDCLSTSFASGVPTNYADYCAYIKQQQYEVFLLAPGYPDNDPANFGWFQALPWDYVGLWEESLPAYEAHFGATDYCNSPSFLTIPPPVWWDPSNAGAPEKRTTRIHIINNGLDAEASANHESFTQVLTRVKNSAVSRGAGTIWITETAHDPVLGSVYGLLPDYWPEEVALFANAGAVPHPYWTSGFGTIGPGETQEWWFAFGGNGDAGPQLIQAVPLDASGELATTQIAEGRGSNGFLMYYATVKNNGSNTVSFNWRGGGR